MITPQGLSKQKKSEWRCERQQQYLVEEWLVVKILHEALGEIRENLSSHKCEQNVALQGSHNALFHRSLVTKSRFPTWLPTYSNHKMHIHTPQSCILKSLQGLNLYLDVYNFLLAQWTQKLSKQVPMNVQIPLVKQTLHFYFS